MTWLVLLLPVIVLSGYLFGRMFTDAPRRTHGSGVRKITDTEANKRETIRRRRQLAVGQIQETR